MTIPIKTSLEDDGLAKNLIQFAKKTNIVNTLKSYLEQADITDQGIFDLLEAFDIEVATAALLDYIGWIIGGGNLDRNGEDDETFRKRIKDQILIINSDGTPNSLLEILASITQGRTTIWEHYPLNYMIFTTGSGSNKELANSLVRASPVTTGNVVLVEDLDGLSFDFEWIGSSITAPMITDSGDYVVDNLGGRILVSEDFTIPAKNNGFSWAYPESFNLVTDSGDYVVDGDGDIIAGFTGTLSYIGGSPFATAYKSD